MVIRSPDGTALTSSQLGRVVLRAMKAVEDCKA